MKKLEPKPYDLHAFVCHGSKCSRAGASEIRSDLRKDLRDKGLNARVSRTTCQGYCKQACVVFTEGKKANWWAEVKPTDIPKLGKKLAKKVLK